VHDHPDIVFVIVKARQDELMQRAETQRLIEELKGGNRVLLFKVVSKLGNILAARRIKLQIRYSHACPEQIGTESLN
jgi:hypothetical protein